MPRRINPETAERIKSYEGDNLGMQLGAAAVAANLPVTYVAKAFLVSRNTVQGWFLGSTMKQKHRQMAEALVTVIRGDLSVGELPAKTLREAKLYLEELTGGASGHDCSK